MINQFRKIRLIVALLAMAFLPAKGWGQSKVSELCRQNAARNWWDVTAYHLTVSFYDLKNGAIQGYNRISAKVIRSPSQKLQLDLDTTMHIQSLFFEGQKMSVSRQGTAYYLSGVFDSLQIGDTFSVLVIFQGIPQEAKSPPWDGGFVRTKDENGIPWWSVACEGKGSYLWFPCKNARGDRPDSVVETYLVPKSLTAVGNGRLISVSEGGKTKSFRWKVTNPINNYNITFYLGDYVHWSDTFNGLKGPLDLNYYVLKQKLKKAKKQFKEVKPMLSCFESHFGAYPFYKDGFKLVEAPYLGMEHQSAVAYGNHFKMGYLGRDRSRTGVGLLFDFIIIHESAHEWFGNSIAAKNIRDTWVHEGFASYAETVFAQCVAGKQKAFQYQRGKRATLQNTQPVVGDTCEDGSSDAYDKAGFMIHQIRLIMKSDTAFFDMIKAMDVRFKHQLVTGKEIENFINQYSGIDFSKVFEQYLHRANLPTLVFYKNDKGQLMYQWQNCVTGFNMPVKYAAGKKSNWLYPTTTPKILNNKNLKSAGQISRDFLIKVKFED